MALGNRTALRPAATTTPAKPGPKSAPAPTKPAPVAAAAKPAKPAPTGTRRVVEAPPAPPVQNEFTMPGRVDKITKNGFRRVHIEETEENPNCFGSVYFADDTLQEGQEVFLTIRIDR